MRGLDPAEDLIAVAGETGADFIVIGLRRRTPVGKLILGSNAQRILLEAPCPVLAVKAEEEAAGPRYRARSQITGEPAADALLDRDPFSPARRHAARPAVPDGARLRRAGRRSPSGSASTTWTRPRSRRRTPRRSPRCARPRRPCTATRGAWPAGCRRWPTVVVDQYGGDAAALWTQRGQRGRAVRRLQGAAGLRRRQGEDLRRAAGQAARASGRTAGRRPPAATPRTGRTARWPTSSTRPAWPRSGRSSSSRRQPAHDPLSPAGGHSGVNRLATLRRPIASELTRTTRTDVETMRRGPGRRWRMTSDADPATVSGSGLTSSHRRHRPARDPHPAGAGGLRVLRPGPALPADQPDAGRDQRAADGRPHRAPAEPSCSASSASSRRGAAARGDGDRRGGHRRRLHRVSPVTGELRHYQSQWFPARAEGRSRHRRRGAGLRRHRAAAGRRGAASQRASAPSSSSGRRRRWARR